MNYHLKNIHFYPTMSIIYDAFSTLCNFGTYFQISDLSFTNELYEPFLRRCIYFNLLEYKNCRIYYKINLLIPSTTAKVLIN